MSSFSCPHFCAMTEACQRLGTLCVPGRPGCVLPKTTVFATPWQARLESKLRGRAESASSAPGANAGQIGEQKGV